MNVYIICPVRGMKNEYKPMMEGHVRDLEKYGHTVFYPPRDADQKAAPDKLVESEILAIAEADEVHIFWDNNSYGSHFDLGVAMALSKPIQLVYSLVSGSEHSYETVIKKYQAKSNE